jgi:glycosidase
MAMTLISTVRGIPQIYYGSEIGMRGEKSKGDADIRRDFPGGWKGDSQNAFDPATQTAEQKEFYDFTKKLLNWRKAKEVIHTGQTMHYMPKDKVYVYFRYNDKERVMVVINNNDKEQNFDLIRFAESLKGVSTGKDILSGKEITVDPKNKLTVSAKSSLILELK